MSERTLPTRYSAVSPLASGGMGDVYRATDGLLGRTVAVKVLAERHARNPDVRARFTREARAAARLSAHPNVVTVFDVGEHDGQPFIVMEYLDGGSVHDRIRSTPVAPGLAIEWLRQAAAGLDAAHAQGIVHRDVKPANLLLDDEDRVHVTDFGIASAAGFDTLTLPGTVLGTAGYLSPEQARGETATAASDRYALGVVAYELLTGQRPYAAETPVTEAFAHLNAPIPSAAEVAPALPAASTPSSSGRWRRSQTLVLRAPASSSRSSSDVFRDAEPVTAVLPRSHPTAAPPRAATMRRWLAPLAFVVLLLGGLTAAAFVSNGDEPEVRTITRVTTTVSTVSDTESTLTVTETATVPEEETTAPSSGSSGSELNDAGLRAHAGRGLRRRAPAARAGGLTARGLGVAGGGLRELQPRVHPPRARELRRRARAARPLRGGAGRPIRDRPASPRSGEAVRRRSRKGQGQREDEEDD